MTKITFTDGKPVMRDGKVGTGQECCCDGQCTYRYVCVERIEHLKAGKWDKWPTSGCGYTAGDADDVPLDQPPGTVIINTGTTCVFPPEAITGCAGAAIKMKIYMSGGDFGDLGPCDGPSDFNKYIFQTYTRLRLVDSCSECSELVQVWEYPDGREPDCCDSNGQVIEGVASCDECLSEPDRQCTHYGRGDVVYQVETLNCYQLTDEILGNALTPWAECLAATGVSACRNPLP